MYRRFEMEGRVTSDQIPFLMKLEAERGRDHELDFASNVCVLVVIMEGPKVLVYVFPSGHPR